MRISSTNNHWLVHPDGPQLLCCAKKAFSGAFGSVHPGLRLSGTLRSGRWQGLAVGGMLTVKEYTGGAN